jgi:hypothetical protein
MPMDFNYTNRFDKYPDDRNVYHALTRCRAAEDIKVKHREFGLPPASEQRQPCEICQAEVRAWLDSL